jgi:DNA repair protein RAD5
MVEFKGSTIIDCPPVLHSGADLIVSLSIYLRSTAFKPPSTSASMSTITSAIQKTNMMFNEGQETLDEQVLRERKSSLLKLFDVIGLKPRAGADFIKQRYKNDNELHEEAVKNTTQAKKPPKIEIVGDGEEVEVEEGEDLSENELNMIYKKWVRSMSWNIFSKLIVLQSTNE